MSFLAINKSDFSMKPTRHYLIVDTKKHRRHSAPEGLGTEFTFQQSHLNLLKKEDWCRASVSDFSVLLENQSESGSSLELDTSNLSRDLSPIPTLKSSPKGSYQKILATAYEDNRRRKEEDSLWNNFGSWFIWKNILLSQAIAGCLAIMNVSNTIFQQSSQNFIINGQNFPHYILLGAVWTTKLATRNNGRDIIEVIKFSGFRYLFLSVLHVEANYLLCSSFHHNSYLGNQMIDCVATSLSMMLAYVCLEVQFRLVHITGFVFSIIGAIGLCIANIVHKKEYQENVLLGDVLRMASGICLAFNSTAQEIIVKSIDFVEYMGMIGLIGSLICGLQAITLETNRIVPRDLTYWPNLFSYSMAQFFLNSLTPIVLRHMGGTGLHLALTTSGFYSYFIVSISQRDKFQLLYLLSFVVATIGSVLFTLKRTTIVQYEAITATFFIFQSVQHLPFSFEAETTGNIGKCLNDSYSGNSKSLKLL